MHTLLIKRSALVILHIIFILNWTTLATAADASLSWDANTETDLAGYKVYYGTSSGSYGTPIDVGNQTSLTVTGLSASQTYYFSVTAYNASQAESGYSTEVSKNFGDTTAPTLSGIAAGSITSNGATITWSTNEAATSQVEYGLTTTYGSTSALNSTLVTSHSRLLGGLNPSTTYHYRVISQDAAGNIGTSGDGTFTTSAAADTTPPAISGIGASNVTTSAATISWTTDEVSDTQIQYGTTTSYGSSTTLITALTTSHSQQMTGLLPSTLYHYRVLSRDGAGNPAVSGDRTFTTVTPPDTTGPILSNITASVSSTSAVVNWNTNEAATSQVEYGITPSYGASTALNTTPVTSHSRTLSGLSPSTIYNYRVISQDAAGNITVSGNGTFTTSATADTTAPVISNIAAGNLAAASVEISWNTNEAATSQVQYGPTPAYGSLSSLDTTLLVGHNTLLTNLQPATTYNYRVISRDASGNTATSGNNSFTTAAAQPPPDTAGPTLSDINAGDITAEGVTISWGTDELATSEVEYGLTVEYGTRTTVNDTLSISHRRTLSGLQPNTVYHYRVKSADAVGNLSTSTDHTFTTNPLTDSVPPADVENFTAVPGTQVITLSWVNPSDSDFIGVRIVYRTDRFPNGLDDGEILGDFSGQRNEAVSVIHAGLEANVTYFYSASSYDDHGNYQHTARASATPSGYSSEGTSGGGGGGCALLSPRDREDAGPWNSADWVGMVLILSLAALRKGVKKLGVIMAPLNKDR